MFSHPRRALTSINYYVGPAKSATSHQKVEGPTRKKYCILFRIFPPNLAVFHAFLALSLFWQVVWVARVECFFLLPLPSLLLLLCGPWFCFWLNFLLFGLFIVLVDFHVHCEHKNKASQNKCWPKTRKNFALQLIFAEQNKVEKNKFRNM